MQVTGLWITGKVAQQTCGIDHVVLTNEEGIRIGVEEGESAGQFGIFALIDCGKHGWERVLIDTTVDGSTLSEAKEYAADRVLEATIGDMIDWAEQADLQVSMQSLPDRIGE